jgi:ABC-type amino acid transport substrate-binding protein
MMKNTTEVTTLAPGKLTVCTYGGFAPVCYKNSDGQLIGLDVSFLTRFAESLGLEIVTIEHLFDGIWEQPDAGKCDVAGAGVMKRKDRPVRKGGSWSDEYYTVNRSLLVRAGEAEEFAVDKGQKPSGKTIVVTKGSTADIDAHNRYPDCTIKFVDDVDVAKGQKDPQEYIVKTLIPNRKVDAFGEGDVSNTYLRDEYGKDGSLALTDIHRIDNVDETFNFITRNDSLGVLDQLNAFIARNKACYASK